MGKEKPLISGHPFDRFREIKREAKRNSPKGTPDMKALRAEVKAMDAKNRKP